MRSKLKHIFKRRLYGHEGDRWDCYWWFVGWWAISFGFHVSIRDLNVEIHLPFGFIRAGRAQNPAQVSEGYYTAD